MSVCILILTRVSPPSQKTIYNFNLVVGNTTKHMKHGRSCDIIQMMHGSEWTLKYDESEVENVARGRSPSATFSTEGHRISMSHERLCLTCFVAPPGRAGEPVQNSLDKNISGKSVQLFIYSTIEHCMRSCDQGK